VPQRKSLQAIPTFESEDEEREFWATHDSADYVDWSRAKAVSFPAQAIAKENQGSLRIHKMDGTFEDERTYPHKADSGLPRR
jgi:CopG antitoxin of type II toxin-antitoxin system/uncharacterized protein DUF2188